MVMTPTANAKIPKIEVVIASLEEEDETSTELESLMERPLKGVSGCGAMLCARLMCEFVKRFKEGMEDHYIVTGAPSSPIAQAFQTIFRFAANCTANGLRLGVEKMTR